MRFSRFALALFLSFPVVAAGAVKAESLSPDETIAEALAAVRASSAESDPVIPGAYIQLAAETNKDIAVEKLAGLLEDGVNATIQRTVVNGVTYYRVLAGPYDTQKTAAGILPRFLHHGFAKGTPFVRMLPKP